jgi:hypothetical protein
VPDDVQPIYHRLQPPEQNELMERTQQVGGRPMRNIDAGLIPRVKAYIGALPAGRSGIEFTTSIEPDRGSPPGQVSWSEGRPGVLTLEPNELVVISVTILKRQD